MRLASYSVALAAGVLLRVLIGLALATAALVRKSRVEERWLREEFGEEYERYRAEVPALIPRP